MIDQSTNPPATSGTTDPFSYRIVTNAVDLSLAEFMIYCMDARDKRLPQKLESKELDPLRLAFLDAGVKALEANAGISNWVHFGLELKDRSACGELYRRTANMATALLRESSISNFFFMHKPPGMRIRFEIGGGNRRRQLDYLRDQLQGWQNEGLVERVFQGVYEPETHLFGGPVSTRSVHELFTIDSLAWLNYHALAVSKGDSITPAWALSLVMLRALFTGLGITDLEDIDVWDKIRRKLGRSLHHNALSHPEFAASAAEVRSFWERPQSLAKELSSEVGSIADGYQDAVIPVARRWSSDYFASGDAYIGPRTAAALVTIFHWNRAGLQSIRQALLAESLAERW